MSELNMNKTSDDATSQGLGVEPDEYYKKGQEDAHTKGQPDTALVWNDDYKHGYEDGVNKKASLNGEGPLVTERGNAMKALAKAEIKTHDDKHSAECSEHGTIRGATSNYFDAQADARQHNLQFHKAALAAEYRTAAFQLEADGNAEFQKGYAAGKKAIADGTYVRDPQGLGNGNDTSDFKAGWNKAGAENSANNNDSPKEGKAMATRNEAGAERRNLVAALTAQQAMIAAQGQQIELLRQGMLTVAKLAGIDSEPKLAALKSEADNEEPVATTDEQALAPAAVDDPQVIGGAPAPANTEVTPDAGTNVQAPEVALPQDALNQTVDVTAPTPNTDAPNPNAVVDHEPEVLNNPQETPLPDNSGWAANNAPAPAHVSSKDENPQVRLFTAMKLAKSRNALGMGSGDELADAQAIVDDRDLSLASIAALNAELENVTNSVKTAAKDEANRGRVPQRASGVNRTVASLQAPTRNEGPTGSGPGTPDASEFGDL